MTSSNSIHYRTTHAEPKTRVKEKTPPLEVNTQRHRWELPGNYPVFTVVMVIYHYVERIWIILVTPFFKYNIYNP